MKRCQSSRASTDFIDAPVETVDMVPQGIDSCPSRIRDFGYLANGGRIVLFLPVGHALDPVASGVDFTGGDFHLAGLDTVLVQGHLVAAADGHLVEGYVLLGGNLDGTVVIGQLDVVAAGEVLHVTGLDLLHRLAVNLAFPAAVGSRLHLFVQLVQRTDHGILVLVPDVIADLGNLTQIRSLGHIVMVMSFTWSGCIES